MSSPRASNEAMREDAVEQGRTLDPGAVPRFAGAPDSALDAVRSFDGPVLVDLDETLYLRNSTEDFLDGARPGLPALVLLRALDLLRPWRLTGGEPTRDVWRVWCIGLLFPWTWLAWRYRVRALARLHVNWPLLEALRARDGDWRIVTDGFGPIVTPLCRAMGLGDVPIVSCRLRPADRRRGKRHRATAALGAEVVAHALVLTDSWSDRDLLEACARPLIVAWPGASCRLALRRVYLPGEYVSRVKHPGERYLLHGIVLEEFALWMLGSLALSAEPAAHTAGLFALLVSFWAIYERGYADNDRAAFRYETDPKLTAGFFEAEVATPPLRTWLWALGAGAIGLLLVRHPNLPTPIDLFRWTTVLAATAGLYFLYNRIDKRTRVWLYLGLQFARAFAIAPIVTIAPAGALALAAHALSRWLPYAVYRATGPGEWPRVPAALARLVVFGALTAAFATFDASGALQSWTTAAIVAWMLFRGRRELADCWREARWLAK